MLRTAQLLRTESRAKELRALLRMSREITSALDLDRLLLTAANILSGIVAFDRCCIAMERDGALRVAAVSGKEKPDLEDPGVKAVGELLGWLRGFEATVYSPSPDALEETDPEKAKRFRAHAEATKMQSMLVIPLKDESGFIGLLSMEAAGEDFVEEGQQELVEIYANLVAVSLRNAELYRQTPLSAILGGGRGGGAASAITGFTNIESGMSSWNCFVSMKSMNARAPCGLSAFFNTPANSYCRKQESSTTATRGSSRFGSEYTTSAGGLDAYETTMGRSPGPPPAVKSVWYASVQSFTTRTPLIRSLRQYSCHDMSPVSSGKAAIVASRNRRPGDDVDAFSTTVRSL